MNKQAIAKTAVCYWSQEDACYLMQSPLFDTVLGVGDTVQEAQKTFQDLLDDAYEAYLEGRVPGYGKPGRPAKGGVSFDTNIQSYTKQHLKEIADEIGCSMGEVVDYLVFQYDNHTFDKYNYPTTRDAGGMVAESLFSNQQIDFIQEMIQHNLTPAKTVKKAKSSHLKTKRRQHKGVA